MSRPQQVDSSSADGAIDLFTCPEEFFDEERIRRFVVTAISARLQAESRVLEFKARRTKSNVAEAVAALSNTDGGMVLVGVDEKAEDPLVGVDLSEVDATVAHIRSLLPSAMPEVIPVALAGRERRVVLVLRVDAEEQDHPVVLDGRVLVRVPGQSVGARRDEIVRLVEKGRAGIGEGSFAPPIDVGQISMWDGDRQIFEGAGQAPVELRVRACFNLPRSALDRRWLGTSGIEAVVESLERSPVPSLLQSDHLRSHEISAGNWSSTEIGALRARLRSALNPPGHRGRPRFQASGFVTLAGRRLDVVIATRVFSEASSSITVESMRDILLAEAVAATAAGRALARAIRAGEPLPSAVLEASAMAPDALLTDRPNGHWLTAVPSYRRSDWQFPRLQATSDEVSGLDAVVKAWLTPLLFDHGQVAFEEWLEMLPQPKWARGGSDGAPPS